MTTTTRSHVQTDQIVFTWVPEDWPRGLLTGQKGPDGEFRLAHVVSFDRSPVSALQLVRAGLQAAWEQGCPFVVFHVPHAHPQARGLMALARRVKALEYAVRAETSFFVVYP